MMDEQDIRSFAHAHRELLNLVISPASEEVHAEENLFGDVHSIALFLDFTKSLASLLGGVVAVTKVISSAETLFKWANTMLRGETSQSLPDATLTERILTLIFEAYVNRKAGIREEALCATLATKPEALSKALETLRSRGLVRKAKDETWKYVRFTS
jgi:hypothetical protein